jgi:hypothetical protein
MSDYQNDGPWKWHIEETFKGLIALSIELLKALLLINGGAAVAILAYLGNLASHPVAHLPNMKNALLCFAGGVFTTALAFIAAYFTQFRLYYEERCASHETALLYASLDRDRDRYSVGSRLSMCFRCWLLDRRVGVLSSSLIAEPRSERSWGFLARRFSAESVAHLRIAFLTSILPGLFIGRT